MLTGTQWKNYGIALVGWCDIYDEEFGELVKLAFEAPDADFEGVAAVFTPMQTFMDKLIFKELSSSQTQLMEKVLVNGKYYSLNGKSSGLKICLTIGNLVFKKSTSRCSEAVQEALNQSPVDAPADLKGALTKMQGMFDTMHRQGAPAQNSLRHAMLVKIVSRLTERADMNLLLNMPMAAIENEHPGDADELLRVLDGIADDILGLSRFRNTASRRSGLRQRPLAGGAEPLMPCLEYREYGVCRNGNRCKKHHAKGKGVCQTKQYQETGICGEFFNCKATHPWDEAKWATNRKH